MSVLPHPDSEYQQAWTRHRSLMRCRLIAIVAYLPIAFLVGFFGAMFSVPAIYRTLGSCAVLALGAIAFIRANQIECPRCRKPFSDKTSVHEDSLRCPHTKLELEAGVPE
jgi:hypothetical protein